MKLYFLRHADALPGADDAVRPLSPLGRKQSRKMGRFLRKAGIEFETAFSSPLVRAHQTAGLVLKTLDSLPPRKLQITDALLNETSQAQFDQWLNGLPRADRVLLVGHAPTMDERVCQLLGVSRADLLKLPKGALACLETDDCRVASLKFFVTPKLLGL
jgi:phosphohistidine phosphatase